MVNVSQYLNLMFIYKQKKIENKKILEEKNMFRKSKIIFALVLAVVMCFSTFITAMADDDDTSPDPQVTPTPAAAGSGSAALNEAAAVTSSAAITKLLQVPFGVTRPNLTYTFTVEPISIDGNTSPKPPVIGTEGIVTIDFNDQTSYRKVFASGDVITYAAESAELFEGADWSHGGVYEYQITENCTHPASTGPSNSVTDTYICSKAEYKVLVYVRQNDDGSFTITHIGVIQEVEDNGDAIPLENQTKVDPTPGGNTTENKKPYSELEFANAYIKTNIVDVPGKVDDVPDPDPEGPENPDIPHPDNATLYLGKTVDGSFTNKSLYFRFEMTVYAPSLAPDIQSFKAVVVEKNGNNYKFVKTSELTDTDMNNFDSTIVSGGTITFPANTAQTFFLKHNQYLLFLDAPVGSHYTVKEAGTEKYTPSVTVRYDTTRSIYTPGLVNNGLNIPEDIKDIEPLFEGLLTGMTAEGFIKNLYVSNVGSSAEYVNSNGSITPTGLNLNDLPFVTLIALALVALIVFAASKSRKKRTETQA